MKQLESRDFYPERSILVMVVPNPASRSAWRDDGDHSAIFHIIPIKEGIISSSFQLVRDKLESIYPTDVYQCEPLNEVE